jgi:hypothetical protein
MALLLRWLELWLREGEMGIWFFWFICFLLLLSGIGMESFKIHKEY